MARTDRGPQHHTAPDAHLSLQMPRGGDNAKALSHEEVAKCASQRNGVAFSCLVDIFDNAINRGAGQLNDTKRRRLD